MGKAKRARQLRKIQARREVKVAASGELNAIPVGDAIVRQPWEKGDLRRAPLWPGRYMRPDGTCGRCGHALWRRSQGQRRLYCAGCGWR